MNKTYVIDGSNVCWWYSQTQQGEASILPLLTILIALINNGDDFFCVFDANVTHVLGGDDNELVTKSIVRLLEMYPSKFYRVTGATRADGVVLHDADHHGRDVITNDIYRDYKVKYAWLNQHTARLIQGNLHPSGLMTLEKLPYGRLSLLTDTENALHCLFDLLEGRTQPDITAAFDDFKIDNSNHKFTQSPVSDRVFDEKSSEKVSGGVNKNIDSKIDPEEQRIKNAQAALKDFYKNQIFDEYAPENFNRYFLNYGHKEIIKFEGVSWDVAVKRLDIFFESNKVCSHCYHIQPIESRSNLPEDICMHCKKQSLAEIPEIIWGIIEKHAPDGNKSIRELIDEKKERKAFDSIGRALDGSPPVVALAVTAVLGIAKIVDKIRGK